MSERPSPDEGAASEIDESAIGRKYGLRELIYPESEQMRALSQFLSDANEHGSIGPVPEMAVRVMLEFVQATLNRQNITKGPGMSHEEFDVLQAPYYLATRIVSKAARDKRNQALQKGRLYQTTYVTLNQFAELLRNLLDPSCQWLKTKVLPQNVREVMGVMLDFTLLYPDQRRKGRAL